MKAYLLLIIGLCLFCLCTEAEAQSHSEIDSFIQASRVVTYDCPSADSIPQLQQYLKSNDLTSSQRSALTVHKTHWMICMGQYEDAKVMLDALVADSGLDQGTLTYAAAIYQLGFLYDVKEEPLRCDYYRQARELARNKFDDIYLSSQLGLITECSGHRSEGENLGNLYVLLEQYSSKGDKASLAHIHNNIGLFYGQQGQQVLAAEQYMKAYKMGLEVYNGSNLASTLISVISAQMGAGDFAAAKQSIDELRKINLQVNTPQSNVWLYFAESGYYYRTGDYDNLRHSLAKWKVFLDKINSTIYRTLYRWYHAALCLQDKDRACLDRFLQQQSQAEKGYQAYLRTNKDYMKFMVQLQFFLGNYAKAQQEFEAFSAMMFKAAMRQQASGKVLGVASLHNQIIALGSSLQEEQQRRHMVIGSLILAFTLIFLIVGYVLRRAYYSRQAIDPLTGLRNTRAALNAVKAVDAPLLEHSNAIALFDFDDIRQMSSQHGLLAAEEALGLLAKTIKNVTREVDIIGRIAFDQFMLCLSNVEEQQAKRFFNRVCQALEDTSISVGAGNTFKVKVVMSVYVTHKAFSDLDEVLVDMQNSIAIEKQSVVLESDLAAQTRATS